MGIFGRWRRRADLTPKDAALAEAHKATRSLRRRNADAERHRSGKQANPVERMTTNQWIGGGS